MVELRQFDAAAYLEGDAAIAAFLAEAATDANPDVFLAALADAARARGITEIAGATGLDGASLQAALAPGADPSYQTLRKIISAIGAPFDVVVPVQR